MQEIDKVTLLNLLESNRRVVIAIPTTRKPTKSGQVHIPKEVRSALDIYLPPSSIKAASAALSKGDFIAFSFNYNNIRFLFCPVKSHYNSDFELESLHAISDVINEAALDRTTVVMDFGDSKLMTRSDVKSYFQGTVYPTVFYCGLTPDGD